MEIASRLSSPPAPARSLVGRSALVRLAGVAVVLLGLWAAIGWAVDLP